ncbi:putative membrane protein YccC [Bradyrhizobium sp. USDA 4510]
MAILRHHAIADHLRALRQARRQRHHHRLVDGADRDVARLARGVEQADRRRRHRFVEAEHHRPGCFSHHAAVGRFGADQDGMRMG